MDNTKFLLRGWRDALAQDNAVDSGKGQVFSRVIGKYVLASEKRGWETGEETAKDYIELAEGMLPEGGRWEEGREALRWLVRFLREATRRGGEKDWRAAVEHRLREKQYAGRTVETYGQWVGRFTEWCGKRGVAMEASGGGELKGFLDELAVEAKVMIATQHQALNAVVWFFKEVLHRPLEGLDGYLRARNSDRVPVVLSQEEVKRLLEQLEGTERLRGEVMSGGGLRLMELLRLRVKDVDVERGQVTVRDGKGGKDRITPLAERTAGLMKEHLVRLRGLWQEDVGNAVAGVYLPEALGRKYPAAGVSFEWQWVFPTRGLVQDPESGLRRRHHLNETVWQRVVKLAAQRAGITKRVTPHVLRHSFATQMTRALHPRPRPTGFAALRPNRLRPSAVLLERGTDICHCGASAPRALRAA